MANTNAIWQQGAHTTYQLSSPSCSTRVIQRSLTLNENYLSVLEKSQENGPLAEKWQDRKSKRTRQKRNKRGDRKGESNDSPEIPDRKRTSDIPGLPSGADRETETERDRGTLKPKQANIRHRFQKKKKKRRVNHEVSNYWICGRYFLLHFLNVCLCKQPSDSKLIINSKTKPSGSYMLNVSSKAFFHSVA